MVRLTLAACALAFVAPSADVKTFDFTDPKEVNSVAFWTEDGWEPISGVFGGVSGKLDLDLESPEKSRGEVTVKVDTLRMANDGMRDSTLDEWCMDAKNHPTMTFKVEGVRDVQRDGDVIKAIADGTLTVRGVSDRMAVPVTATYLPGALRKRNGGTVEGDLVRVVSRFTFSRAKHGVGKTAGADLISDTVHVQVVVVGQTQG